MERIVPLEPSPPDHLRRARVQHYVPLGCSILHVDTNNVPSFITSISADVAWRSFAYVHVVPFLRCQYERALCHLVKCGTRVVLLDAPIGVRRSMYALAKDRDVLCSGGQDDIMLLSDLRLSSTVAAAVNWAEEMEVNNVDTVTYYVCSPAMVCNRYHKEELLHYFMF